MSATNPAQRSYDEAVSVRHRLVRIAVARAATLALASGLLVACGSSPVPPAPSGPSVGPPTAPSATASVAKPSLTPGQPSLTPVPGAPSSAPPTPLPSTTNAEFGRVWDALPPSWPEMPGQSESEIASGASAGLNVNGAPVALAKLLATELERRGWHVDVGSPLEDGTVVVDATHAPAGCKVEARFSGDAAASDPGTLIVYYGAACPFS